MKSFHCTATDKHLFVLPSDSEIDIDGIDIGEHKPVYAMAHSQRQAILLILARLADERGISRSCVDFDGASVTQTLRIEHLNIFDWAMENA